MKKIIVALVLVLTICALLPTLAFATTAQETEIANIVKEHEKVLDAKSIVYQRICVVAVKTAKFVNKSEYDSFKQQLEKTLKEKFELDAVVITRSPKAMHAIENISKMPESKREEEIRKFVQFQLERKPHSDFQPR